MWGGDKQRGKRVGCETPRALVAQAGIKTCLVESGAHTRDLQEFYPDALADYVCGSVLDLVPPIARTDETSRWDGLLRAVQRCEVTIRSRERTGLTCRPLGNSGVCGGGNSEVVFFKQQTAPTPTGAVFVESVESALRFQDTLCPIRINDGSTDPLRSTSVSKKRHQS